ncbi:MAG: cation-translocating P-type ATPase [Dehalococcoidales bacterium]|nr:cation-translocating P-type ATPase [Dehalococcoidales bacterium]
MNKKIQKTKNDRTPETKNTKWYQRSVTDTLKSLSSNIKGLTAEEARKRLEQYGYNELRTEEGISPWKLFAAQFKSVLIIILLVAVALSVVIGVMNWEAGKGLPEEITDAIVIFAIVIACVFLGFIEEYRSEKAMAALKKMAAPTATILRDGSEVEITAKELVPGDIVILNTGDRIPADLRLIEVANLSTQEAPLTGESIPVEKTSALIEGEAVSVGDRKNMAYTGTTVTYGRGRGVVIATGMQTEFGKIATMLQDVEEEKTPLQQNLDKVGKWLGIACLGIVIIIVAIQLIFIRAHTFVEMFIWGVSMAVAAVPEALPAVVVISLSIGVQKMVKRHALIRRLSAVETLGSTTVICSDKTGTLTQDQMTVRQIYVSGKLIHVTGSGYEPKGEFQIDGKTVDISHDTTFQTFMKINALCNDTRLLQANGKWEIKGDPTEGGLLVVAAKAGIKHEGIIDESPRVDEIPFSSERKRMTTIHTSPDGKVAYSKGAPEIILESCTHILEDGQKKPLAEKDKALVLDKARGMAEDALRVLGTAYKPLTGAMSRDNCEKEMIFAGLAGMIDPPRLEVKDALKVCADAGIKSVMITGDHKITASAIARELGILKPDGIAITGAELDKLSDAEYEKMVGKIDVYARVSPSHKLKIVEAFSKRGDVVAMTGDGVNDAPALKKADIGVAMGISGTDVSKEAAAMVLTDDNFASIVAAVEEGRGIFGNIKKYLMYLLSSNLGELLLMAGAILLGPLLGLPTGAIPLIAVQILLVNLITDGLPALALAVDPPEPGIMLQKPRPRGQGIFTRPVVMLMSIGGIWSALVNLGIFKWALDTGKDMVEAQSLCFLTLIIIQLFKAYNFRSDNKSIFRIGMFKNKWLNIAVLSQVILLWVIVEVPLFNELFNTFPLTLSEWLIVVIIAGTIFPVLEISKFFIRKQEGKSAVPKS